MKKSLVIGALVVGFFNGCATLTEAYSDTVNSINETAREINVKNEQNRNKNNKSTNNNYTGEEVEDTRWGTW
ncbi:hypothetical protein [Campylobacter lanienae]|uniref:hypothetical protein n=1 Tax=Campylobacter lanienae TaxID=75658 RepID=UPI000BB44976|nr:hypothetical protein [Campylobacter lanienae]